MTRLADGEHQPVSVNVQVVRGRPPFEGFYRHEYRPVLALAHVLSGSPHLAEEVTQEVFMAAYRQWDRIDNPEGWVRTAVSNKVHSWRRRRYAARSRSEWWYQPVASRDRPRYWTHSQR